jgi:RNA polymerase sigma factor (sigma-70 family)
VEASAFPAPAAVARHRPSLATPLLRLRSDEQLVALFRAGHDEAFRVIHDRYRQRLFAYTRQMLPRRPDAEDALQDIFVRAYAGLRANHRELALRAWLYRVAHNRCIDELRRPAPPPPEVMQLLRAPVHDPIAEADQRESLRRLIADVRRLPDQQRSALLMRELGGMSYADLSAALGVTVPAVKSLLVRARLALGQASEARDTACSEIREALILAHDRGLRPGATARRHMHDCVGCREFRHQLRGVSRRFAAIVPTLGPLGVLANLLGVGGAGGGAAGGALAASGAAGTSTAVVGGAGALSAGHVATLLAAAVVTAGGAVEIQHVLPASPPHHARAHAVAVAPRPRQAASGPAYTASSDEAAGDASAPAIGLPVRPVTGTASAGSNTSSTGTGGPQAGTSSTTSANTTTTNVKLRATGGAGIAISGGVSPGAPADSTPRSTAGSATTPAGTATTPTSSSTSSTDSTQAPGAGTSTTSSSTTSPGQPSNSSATTGSTSTGSTSTGTASGTGSSTGAGTGGTASPGQ